MHRRQQAFWNKCWNMIKSFYSKSTAWVSICTRLRAALRSQIVWIPATALIWLLPAALSPETHAFVINLFITFIIDLIVVGAIKGTVQHSRPVYLRVMW